MQREQLIPHVASTIDTYMKKHNVSIEVAQENIHKLKEESWKDLNSEWLNPCNDVYPKQLLERIFNLARTMEFMYNKRTISPTARTVLSFNLARIPFTACW